MATFFVSMPKETWGIISVLIGIAAYLIYIQKTLLKKDVLPHPLSWFVWAFVTGVATVVQWEKGAGAGAWVTALTTMSCVAIWLLALFKQRRLREHRDDQSGRSSWFDWVSFGLGISAALLFGFAKNATAAAILATVADILGYKPTISKGWTHPNSDSALAFLLNSAKFVPAYFALNTISIATALYPVALIIANSGVTVMLVIRRIALHGSTADG